MIRIAVQIGPIDLAGELARIEAEGAGAVATFSGHVRRDDGVDVLELEHYPGMTERALADLAEKAAARWNLIGVTIVHRVGALVPGEHIVFVAASAKHRGEALAAVAALIDWLKCEAPFWKRETRGNEQSWVDARAARRTAARAHPDQSVGDSTPFTT